MGCCLLDQLGLYTNMLKKSDMISQFCFVLSRGEPNPVMWMTWCRAEQNITEQERNYLDGGRLLSSHIINIMVSEASN